MSKKIISYVMISLILMLNITPVMGDLSSAEIKEIKEALGLTDIKISDSEFENILNSPVNEYEDSTLLDSARAITLEKNYIESLQKADLQNTIFLLDATKDIVDSIDKVAQLGTTQWLGLGGEILKISIGVPIIALSWKNIILHEMIYGSMGTVGYIQYRDELGYDDNEAWNEVYSNFKGYINAYFKTDQEKNMLHEFLKHAWILKNNPNYPTEVNDKAKILADIIRERISQNIHESSPSFLESIFNTITKTIEGVTEKAIVVTEKTIEGVKEYFSIPEEHSTSTTPAITPNPILSPTLSVLPPSGQQGQTFSFSGSQYTPYGIVEWNVRKPNGVEYLPEDITGKVDGAGNFNHNYVSSCESQVGTYTIWAIDKSTGKRSNDVTEIITISDSCVTPTNPTTPSDYEGKLLRQTGDFKVYLIEGSEKRHFTSPEALEWNGHSFDNIIEVSVDVINSFESGADLGITQAIINKYNTLGGAATFGLPAGTGEQIGYLDNAGVICTYVNFQKGAIEYFTNGDQAGNAYAILNPFFSKWASMGYGNSVLGYPISDMSDIQTSKLGTEFKYQHFKNADELGSLEYNLATGEVFEIHGAIYATWSALGYADSELGAITSDERDAVTSFKGTTGRVSDFENGHLHWHSSGDHASTTYMTYGDLYALYVSMGGTDSWLGFPVMHQEDRGGYGYCEFEGGYIEWDGSGYIAKTSI